MVIISVGGVLQVGATVTRTDWNSNESIQRKSVAIPALSVGSNDLSVVWDTPFADTNYHVQTTVEATGATIGGMTSGLKMGTKTTTGCTITAYNTLLIGISAGGFVQVQACGNI